MTHITIEKEELQTVLEALESCDHVYGSEGSHQYFNQVMVDKAIAAVKKAQTQTVQEPRPSFADVVRAEPTVLIQKWRVLELYRAYEHCQFQATPQPVQEPVGEVVVESMGVRGSDAMRVRMHFYKEIPPVGSKIYTTQPAAQPAVQDVAAYLFTNVQSGDIESSTDPDHKQDERELWYREELVRQHHHTKKGRP